MRLRLSMENKFKITTIGFLLGYLLSINIFPQDLSVNRGAYAQYEDGIYTCITAKGASIADLYWVFYYSSTSKTKPINVTYDVKYYDGSCASTSKTFTN